MASLCFGGPNGPGRVLPCPQFLRSLRRCRSPSSLIRRPSRSLVYIIITSNVPRPVIVTSPRSWARIVEVRGRLVILDNDLAALCKTTVNAVNRFAMRNACCFPSSVCFRLSNDEWHYQKSSAPGGTGLAEADRGDWLCAPLAFTHVGAYAVAKILYTFDAVRGSVIVWRIVDKLNEKKRAGE